MEGLGGAAESNVDEVDLEGGDQLHGGAVRHEPLDQVDVGHVVFDVEHGRVGQRRLSGDGTRTWCRALKRGTSVAGKSIQKVEPFPGTLSTPTDPPITSIGSWSARDRDRCPEYHARRRRAVRRP